MPNTEFNLLACPSCKNETLIPDLSGNLLCTGCETVFPKIDGMVDFRYLDQQYQNIEARIEEDFDDPDADSDILLNKQGSAHIMVKRLEKR